MQVLILWLLVPLVGLLFYRSNNGVIWDYYLIGLQTPFLIILALAFSDITKTFKILGSISVTTLLLMLIYSNLQEWKILISDEANLISFGRMKNAIDYVYHEANGRPFNVEIFVPNLLPTAYEYLFSWYGQKKFGYQPYPVQERQRLFFYLMEPGQKYKDGEQYWRNLWYNKRLHSGALINKYKEGEIDIEMRERLSL